MQQFVIKIFKENVEIRNKKLGKFVEYHTLRIRPFNPLINQCFSFQ